MADRKVALVTGASRGVGAGVARGFGELGYTVYVTGRSLAPGQAKGWDGSPLPGTFAETAAQITELGGEGIGVACDHADDAQVAQVFERIMDEQGRLDVLFNNAGIFTQGVSIEDVTLADWQRSVDTNLTGMFLCTREAFRTMKAQVPQGGRIIHNGSISAQVPRPGSVAYAATKHAITGLTRTAALDGRTWNIAVGQIDIGNAASDMTAAMTAGIRQADGSLKVEPVMDVQHAADAVLQMAALPLSANVLQMTVMASAMPFVGRG